MLASIETRYSDELARLERSGSPASAKEHLRQQLAFRRNSAREALSYRSPTAAVFSTIVRDQWTERRRSRSEGVVSLALDDGKS